MFQEFDFTTGKTVNPKRRQVIILLDDAAQAEELLQLLRQKSYPILGKTGDVREALELVSKHKLGILFLDADIAGINAVELLTKIRAKFPEFNVVITSANATKELLTESMANGAIGFLVRPLGQEALQKVLAKIK
jgi:two-component system chemotaxis response regulator CheY